MVWLSVVTAGLAHPGINFLMDPGLEQLRRLIHQTVRCLDDRDYEGFTNLFTPNGEYRIEVDAPELRTKMIWMSLSRDELCKRFASVPEQEWRRIDTTHQISVDAVDFEGDSARTTATVSIFRTDEEGRTECYAVGRYEDTWQRSEGDWRLSERVLDLRTRLLSVPTPLPI